SGNLAKAWSFSSLPVKLKERLEDAAKSQGYRNAEHLLSAKPEQWQPPVPMSEVAEHCLDKAVRLRESLRRVLAKRDVPFSEVEQLGMEDYKRHFGHGITSRHLRALVDRTLARDNFMEELDRLELYLDERPARKSPSAETPAAEPGFECLRQTIQNCNNPAAPNRKEKALIWVHAFEAFEAERASETAATVKKIMLRFLWRNVPQLAASEGALRVMFERKYATWIEKERDADALLDGRVKKRGVPTGEPYIKEEIEKITWYAMANCGERVAQAVRELEEVKLISQTLRGSAAGDPMKKSYVTNRLREAVRYDIKAIAPEHEGRRAAEKNLPSLDLNYEGIFAMDCLQADDFTWPVKFRVPDGKGWWTVTRGQCILVNDWRTLWIAGYGLDGEEQPNSLVTRTVFTRVFAAHGIPKILYLERGKVFQDSKLITGGPKTREALAAGEIRLSGAELEMGLRQFGVRFIHARRARTKPVERIGGLLQDLMEGEPGYCGRDERKDCPEVTKYWEREIHRRNPRSLEHFYTQEQWDTRLSELIQKFNSTPQAGKRIGPMSPDQAFEAFWNKQDPPTKLGPECRYLLAHHKIPVTVKQTGEISFNQRGETFRYADEATGALKGRALVAWFNPEIPELCTFSDENMKNPFTVERLGQVNGLVPDENYKRQVARIQAAAQHSKKLYRVLKSKFEPMFRKNLVSAQTAEFGQAVTQQQQDTLSRVQAETKLRTKIHREAAKLGRPVQTVQNSCLADADRGLSLMTEAEKTEES